MLPIPRPRSNGVHTVHNARINLLATAINNLALAFANRWLRSTVDRRSTAGRRTGSCRTRLG